MATKKKKKIESQPDMTSWLNTNIPFTLGQSSIYGADCAGLVILVLKGQGFKCDWERQIIRKPGKYDYFKKTLEECNFKKNSQGTIALVRYPQNAHLGVICGDKIVYQDNTTGKTNIVEIPKNIYRYSYLGDKT